MIAYASITDAYIKGNMKVFYTLIQQLTRREIEEFSNHMEALTIVLRHQIQEWDKSLNCPAENEE